MSTIVDQGAGTERFVEHTESSVEKATEAIVRITKTIPRGTDLLLGQGDAALSNGFAKEDAGMLSDILSIWTECGVWNDKVAPGSTIAIVGSGPIALAALLTAKFYTPAKIIMVDIDDNRLELARSLGATDVVNSSIGNATEEILQLTGGRGVDTAIEVMDNRATCQLCAEIVASGGVIANIGVYGNEDPGKSSQTSCDVGPRRTLKVGRLQLLPIVETLRRRVAIECCTRTSATRR